MSKKKTMFASQIIEDAYEVSLVGNKPAVTDESYLKALCEKAKEVGVLKTSFFMSFLGSISHQVQTYGDFYITIRQAEILEKSVQQADDRQNQGAEFIAQLGL